MYLVSNSSQPTSRRILLDQVVPDSADFLNLGLEQMLKWLQEIKEHYGFSQYEAQKFPKLECCYFPLVRSIMPHKCTWRTKTFLSNTKTCWTTDSKIGELTLFLEATINNTLASLGPTLVWFAWPLLVCHFQAHVCLCQLCRFLVLYCTFLHALKLILDPIFNKFIST